MEMLATFLVQCIILLAPSYTSLSFNVGKTNFSKNVRDFAQMVVQKSPILFVGKRDSYFSSLIRNTSEVHLFFEQEYRNLKTPFQYYILHLDEMEQFKEAIINLRNLEIFGTRKNYICITENSSHVQELLYFLWDLNIYRSVVVLENDENISLFHAVYRNCGRDVILKKFEEKDELPRIFDYKIEKFFIGCEIKIAYATVIPWIHKKNGKIGGLLIDFLKLVTENGRFKLVFFPHDYEEDISESYNFNNLYADFEEGKGELFVGLVNNFPSLYFDVTHSLIDDSMMFVIPKGKKMPYWKAMMHIYSIKSWGLTLILLLSFHILLCIAGYFCRERSFRSTIQNFIIVYAIFLGMSVPKKLESTLIRFLFLTMFLICMINSIVIQGKLYSIFSVPVYERDIQDIPTLLESHLPIRFKEGISMLFYDNKVESEEILRVYSPTNKSISEIAEELSKTRDFATILDKVQLVMKPSLGDLVTSIELVNFQIVYLFKKHHYLFEHLNFQIERCIESGFMDRLLSMLKWKRLLEDEDLRKSQKAFMLTLEHLQGPCYVLLIGFILSFISFLVEILIKLI